MTPLKIAACLKTTEIKDHCDWLFDATRDIELQDFMRFYSKFRRTADS